MRDLRWMLAVVLVGAPLVAAAQEPVDLDVVTRIRDEGLNRSRVMETARVLTDDIGQRLTNSPAMRRAEQWTRARLAEFGLANAHLEPFEFGRGWAFSDVDVRMTKPEEVPLLALPKAWTPGTRGPVRGPVELVVVENEADIEKLHGKVSGKIVLLDPPRELKPPDGPEFERYTLDDLAKLAQYPIRPGRMPDFRERYMKRRVLAEKVKQALEAEGALASVEISMRDGGLITVGGNRSYAPGEDPGVPGLVMAAEHYNRVARLLEHGTEVDLEISVTARFHEDDTKANNVIAEIPGTDRKDEIVMAGAHLDSWHAGTGATDNAAGCAVIMEAARILEAIGVKPRRTIRVALWSSEEQGLNGSRAYVAQHFASRPEPTEPAQKALPEWARSRRGPLQLKPEFAKLSAYFNVDNGSGRIRGIYAQENAAVVPIFEAWLKPFADLGADTVTMRDTRGTDHLSFDAVGLPGFQFIQDGLDYDTRTHHTEMDVYDRLQPADLMQASVVLASFLYDAAMRDGMVPRKPLPEEVRPTVPRQPQPPRNDTGHEAAGRRVAGERPR
jgi:carboxypeptidase Q